MTSLIAFRFCWVLFFCGRIVWLIITARAYFPYGTSLELNYHFDGHCS
jgi:hypothetical protein